MNRLNNKKRRRPRSLPNIAAASVLLLTGVLAGPAAQATHVDPNFDHEGQTVVNGCMDDLFPGNLNCTANDVRVADATVLSDTGCAFPGDTVTFTAEFLVELTAQARHDIGLYFATDGDPNADGALTGTCNISTLPEGDLAAPPGGDPFVDLDSTCKGGNCPQPEDLCGDIDDPHSPITSQVITMSAVCIDTDGDGKLNLPNCTSWRQPGANEVCLSPVDAFPGAPSKCRCDIGFNIDIDVPANIEVTKTATPTSVDEPGGDVTFTVSVTNSPSFSSVTIDTLNDDVYGDITQVQGEISSTDCSVPQTIAIDGTYTCMFTASVSGNAGDTETDTVTASGTNDTTDAAVSDSDDATVTIVDVLPTANLTKTADPTSVSEPGGDVEFTVTVTNTSTVEALTLSALMDDIYGDITQVQGDISSTTCVVPQVLAVSGELGDSYTCSFVAAVSGNGGDNQTDTVTGTVSDDDGNTINPFDDATVTIDDVPPAASLTKTATMVVATFEVVVTNDSAAEDLSLDALSDDQFGDITTVQGNVLSTTCAVPQTIAVGGNYTCSFDGKISTSPHTDTVTGTVSDDEGGSVTPSDSATVSFE
jgi:hypothetical protein